MEMGAFLSAPLTGQLETFWEVMEKNGREGQAEDIGQILAYVKSIQTDLADALDEVSYLRDQIQSIEDSTMKARLGRFQEDVQMGLYQAGAQARMVETEVAEGIRNAVDTLKEKGLHVLDKVLDTAHVYQGLGKAENLLMQAVAGMDQKMEAVDRMAEEFHAIRGHVKNIGRAAAGLPAEAVGERDQTRGVLAKVRAGMEYCRKVLAGLGQKALLARAHVMHLHLTTEQKAEKAASVQEIVRELRDASAMDFDRHQEPVQVK